MADVREEFTHRVYGYIPEAVFYEMLNEAKRERIFTNEEGRVDIGALVSELVTRFSEGRIRVVPLPPIVKKEATPVETPGDMAALESEKQEAQPETAVDIGVEPTPVEKPTGKGKGKKS